MKFKEHELVNDNWVGKHYFPKVYDIDNSMIITEFEELFEAIEDIAGKEVREEIENYDELWAVDCGDYVAVGDGSLTSDNGYDVFIKES